jgi:hypothetical protein
MLHDYRLNIPKSSIAEDGVTLYAYVCRRCLKTYHDYCPALWLDFLNNDGDCLGCPGVSQNSKFPPEGG